MSALLIRGLSPSVRSKIEKMALKENLSLNQEVLHLLKFAIVIKSEKEDEEEDRKKVLALGAQDFLEKTNVAITDVVATVTEIIGA